MLDKILKTEKISWKALKPYQPKGLKKTTPERLAKLKKSLKENGFASPFYVWQRGKDIISLDGHHRLMVIEEMAAEGEKIPEKLTCNFLDIKNDKEAKRIFMAYQSHYAQMTSAGFDEFTIDMDMDSIAASFEPFKLNWGFKSTGPSEIDEKDIPSDIKPMSKKGDLFELQSPKGMVHRLYCGSTADAADMMLLVGGDAPIMVFTDPPYGVNYSQKAKDMNKAKKGGGMNERPIVGDHTESAKALYDMLLPAFRNIYQAMSNKCSFYVTAPQGGEIGLQMLQMLQMLQDAGMLARHILIWNKNSPTFSMNRLDYDYKHEPIFYGWKLTHKFYGAGEHKTSVWDINRPSKSPEHPTMKPVELVLNALYNSTKPGDIVLDGFGGSGTTLIACEESGRVCRMMEIEPHYIDVILKRWLNYVPKGKILRNGKKFTL